MRAPDINRIAAKIIQDAVSKAAVADLPDGLDAYDIKQARRALAAVAGHIHDDMRHTVEGGTFYARYLN